MAPRTLARKISCSGVDIISAPVVDADVVSTCRSVDSTDLIIMNNVGQYTLSFGWLTPVEEWW